MGGYICIQRLETRKRVSSCSIAVVIVRVVTSSVLCKFKVALGIGQLTPRAGLIPTTLGAESRDSQQQRSRTIVGSSSEKGQDGETDLYQDKCHSTV